MTIREEMRAALSSLESLPPHETNSLLHSDMHDTPYAKDKSTTTVNSPLSDNSLTTTNINNENNISSLTPNSKKNVSKRRSQVKNACVNCQKACKKCDEGRPCQRCIKLGITSTCQDSPRKERKKGFKRGPYRKKSVTTQHHIIPKRDLSAAISPAIPTATNNKKATATTKKREPKKPKVKNATTTTATMPNPITTSTTTTTDWSTLSSPSHHESPSYEMQHRSSFEMENGIIYNNFIPSLPPQNDAGQFQYSASGINGNTATYDNYHNENKYMIPSNSGNSITVSNNHTTATIGNNYYINNNSSDTLINNNSYQQQHSRNNSDDGSYYHLLHQQQPTAEAMVLNNNYSGYNSSSNSYYDSNVSSSPPELYDIHAYIPPNTNWIHPINHTIANQTHYHPHNNNEVMSNKQSHFYDVMDVSNPAMMLGEDQQWVRSVPIPAASSIYYNPLLQNGIAYQ